MISRRQFITGLFAATGVGVPGSTGSAFAGEPAALVCTVLQDVDTREVLYRNGPCEQRFSPVSTFKIAISIMAYDAGILQDNHHPRWPYRPEFNARFDWEKKTVDPTIWQRDSIVWFSQEIMRRLRTDRFKRYVRMFRYGNQDVSGNPGNDDGLTQAWLLASLTISPDEQVIFIRNFLDRAFPVSASAYEMTAANLPVFEAGDGWTVHGKTGSGWSRNPAGLIDKSRPLGWFVGWAEKGHRRIAFARLEIDDKKSDMPGGARARTALLAGFSTLAREAR